MDLGAVTLNLIGGEWETSSGLFYGTLVDGNNSRKMFDLYDSSSQQIERAIFSADLTFRSGEWSRWSIEDRVKQVMLMADGIAEVEEELAMIEAIHTGIPYNCMVELASSCKFCVRDFAANTAECLKNDAYEGLYGKLHSIHYPLGPCAIIAPWNAPVATIMSKVAAALLAGCTVIIKPSEHAPSSIPLLVKAMLKYAKVPIGVLQVLLGGPEVGKSLVEDDRIRCIQFTGSIPSGRMVGASCGRQLKPMLLELGGSNCVIVLEDACLKSAATQLTKGLTFLNGQWCMGVGRILAHKDIYAELLKLLIEELSKVTVGVSTDKTLASNAIGHIAFEDHALHLKRMISGLLANGGVAHTTAKIPVDHPCYLSPTIITDVDHELCTSCELFGPIATFHSFSDDIQAITMANSCPGKLAGFVFGANEEKAIEIGQQLNTGMIMVNGVHNEYFMKEGAASPPMWFWNAAGFGVDGTIHACLNFFSRRRLIGANGPSKME